MDGPPDENKVAYIIDQLEGIMLAAQRGTAYLGLGRIADIAEAAKAVAECASNLWTYIVDEEELETIQFFPEVKQKVVDLRRWRDGKAE